MGPVDYAIPSENIYHVHEEEKAHIELDEVHVREFSEQISTKHPTSKGHIKVYLLLSFLGNRAGPGAIFHPVIAFSSFEDIKWGDKTYQLMGDQDDVAYIKELSLGDEVRTKSFMRWDEDEGGEEVLVSAGSLNIRSLAYIGYFTQKVGELELLQQIISYAKAGYNYSPGAHFDEYYSLRDNNCQTFVKRILSDLKILRNSGEFVSPFYRNNRSMVPPFATEELQMVDITVTQFSKKVRYLGEGGRKLVNISQSVSSVSSSSVSGAEVEAESPPNKYFSLDHSFEEIRKYAEEIGVSEDILSSVDFLDRDKHMNEKKKLLLREINIKQGGRGYTLDLSK